MILKTIIVAAAFTIVIFLIYKFALNPQVSITPSQCPTNWVYEQPLCKPTYETKCKAFDPSKMGKADKLSFAEQCGLLWS
jgi:hypothetical protein